VNEIALRAQKEGVVPSVSVLRLNVPAVENCTECRYLLNMSNE
jgi:hypothetical protein